MRHLASRFFLGSPKALVYLVKARISRFFVPPSAEPKERSARRETRQARCLCSPSKLEAWATLSLAFLLTLAPLNAEAPASVTDLAQALKHPERDVRRHAAYALAEQGADSRPVLPQLIEGLDDEDEQVWAQCVAAIAKIGPAADPAIPRLAKDLSGGSARYGEQIAYRSAFALGRIGQASLPALRESLTIKQPLARLNAIRAMGWIGQAAVGDLPVMAKLLGDFDKSVRRETAETLAEFGEPALPALREALASPRAAIRAEAAYALGQMDDAAKLLADDMFAALLKESDVDARCMLLRSLAQLQFEPEALGPCLTEALLDQDAKVADAAVNGFLALKDAKRVALPKLTILLASKDSTTRQRAANVLGRMGDQAAPATPILLDALEQRAEDENERVALISAVVAPGPAIVPTVLARLSAKPIGELSPEHWAVRVLRALGPRAVPQLRNALADPNASVRFAGIEATRESRPLASLFAKELLASVGHPEAKVRASALIAAAQVRIEPKDWQPAWRRALGDDAEAVRWSAVRSLHSLREGREALAAELISLLSDPSPKVRTEVILLLGEMGEIAKPATPTLLSLLAKADEECQLAVATCLSRIRPDPALVLPELSRLGAEGSSRVRAQALVGLGALGPGAEPRLEIVERGLRDADANVRARAVTAYAKILADADKIVPVMLSALDDAEKPVRGAGIEALGRAGSRAAPAAPKLIALLDREDDRLAAIDALRQIRSQDPNIYIKPLSHAEVGVRVFAIDALGRIGKPAEVALPELRKLLNNQQPGFIRRRAQEAIKKIEEGKAG